MLRSILGLLLILVGVSLMATGLNDDSSFIQSESARLHGAYVGAALLAVGVIIGKFWSLKLQPKQTTNGFAGATPAKRDEPVEEQIDLFDEPRNKA